MSVDAVRKIYEEFKQYTEQQLVMMYGKMPYVPDDKIDHGTNSGVYFHHKKGTELCPACAKVKQDIETTRRKKRSARNRKATYVAEAESG